MENVFMCGELQKEEALTRMEKLELHKNAIREFIEEDKLNLSEYGGILVWLNEDEKAMVAAWEKETGNLVYHVIKSQLSFGLCYSFLYVSKYPEEWGYDNEGLQEGCPIVFLKNVSDDSCSEYGSIGIRSLFGGLLRVA